VRKIDEVWTENGKIYKQITKNGRSELSPKYYNEDGTKKEAPRRCTDRDILEAIAKKLGVEVE